MNCRRVENLIPLYVEGDLERRSSEVIASHLEWCGRCNWLADEFRESQTWLRSSEEPVFDEAFLTDFRRDVLAGISITRPSFLGSLLGSWRHQWNRRQVLALGAALTIICGVLVLYLYQTKVQHHRAGRALANQTQTDDKDGPSRQDLTLATKPAPGASFVKDHRSHVRAVVSRRTVEASLLSGVNKSSDPENPDKQLIPDATLDSREMLRIEIQTSDPNIRIIWFAPKETDSTQNKPATD